MNETELKEKVYQGVITLAISLVKGNKTMTIAELTNWINDQFPGFEHPYGDSRGVPQTAFKRANTVGNQEGMDALVKAFVSVNGNPIWRE